MTVNSLMFLLKIIIGLVVGSISLIADAVHTLSDVISSGENTSGSRFTRESSYSYNEGKQKPKVIRSSNSSTS